MPIFASEPVGTTHRRYHRVPVFAAHERNGVEVDKPWLDHAAEIGRINEAVHRRYFVTLSHDDSRQVGYLENYEVGEGDVVIGDELLEGHPTLYADMVVEEDVAKLIDSGQLPRRSCEAALEDGRITACALLDPKTDSWFGLPDMGTPYSRYSAGSPEASRPYSGVVAEFVTGSIACYAREEPMAATKSKPSVDPKNATKYEDGEEKKKDDDEKDYEDGGESKDTEPSGDAEKPDGYEDDPMAAFDARLTKIEETIASLTGGGEPAEQLPAEAALEEAMAGYAADAYNEAWPAAKTKLKESATNVVYAKVEKDYRRMYAEYGRKYADKLIDSIIECTPAMPGAPPSVQTPASSASAKADLRTVAKGSNEQYQKIIDAEIARGTPADVVYERSEKLQRAKAKYAEETGGRALPFSDEDALRYADVLPE